VEQASHAECASWLCNNFARLGAGASGFVDQQAVGGDYDPVVVSIDQGNDGGGPNRKRKQQNNEGAHCVVHDTSYKAPPECNSLKHTLTACPQLPSEDALAW